MARERRTISLKPEVDEVIEEKRGKKHFSTYINDHFEDEFSEDVIKKKKELEKKASNPKS